ncbi:spermidine synthase [Sulfuritortus calidifontis]|uniref:Spermidine synthase n=1 Tax=Sulfuritortus calidifontis TaxID=1914471 RepID=A0A4R3K0H7_9PROT|nr:fused MFS/spermidine synthase [Sulfuritortus calidifontis]TCS73448.1 spermidine synthase [Sulfuritortus calidifontis]
MRLFSRQRQGQGGLDPVEVSEKGGIRFLHLGGSAVQSAMRLRDPFALELEYTRAMMGFLLFHPAPREAALIGLGGGSIAKYFHRKLPACRLTAVELNPEVILAARAYFFLPPDDERLTVLAADGAAFVREQPESRDVLLVDAYDAKRIVEALASEAFYRDCHAHLRPGGVAAFNLWGSEDRFGLYLHRINAAFDHHTLILPAERKSNIIVFGFKPPLPETGFVPLAERARALERGLGLEFPAFLERMRVFNAVSDQGFVLTGG